MGSALPLDQKLLSQRFKSSLPYAQSRDHEAVHLVDVMKVARKQVSHFVLILCFNDHQ